MRSIKSEEERKRSLASISSRMVTESLTLGIIFSIGGFKYEVRQVTASAPLNDGYIFSSGYLTYAPQRLHKMSLNKP
jgi:hypothetical protein